MRILIPGGAGYLAGALTDILLDSHHDFLVYDNLTYEDSYRKQCPFVYGDIRDTDKLQKHLDWADAVIWLAAIVGEPACRDHPELACDINADMVKYLAEHYDGRIVFTSTCSVYGAQNELLDESSPIDALGPYAEKKRTAEGYLQDKNAAIFRLGTLFGLGDDWARPRFDIVLNTLTAKAHTTGRVSVFGGDQYRPLLHVQDAAWAIYEAAIDTPKGTFNLHAHNVKIADLAFLVQKHYPGLVVEHTPLAKEDNRNYRVSSKKARDAFGFRPVISLDEGVSEISEALRSGRIKNPLDERYDNKKWLSRSRP